MTLERTEISVAEVDLGELPPMLKVDDYSAR